MHHYLGLDWGAKKIGVALADAETKIAFAHDTLAFDLLLFEEIARIAKEHHVTIAVLGVAVHHEHSDNTGRVKKFKEMLEEKCDVDVILADEMFSSKMAQDNRKAAGKKNIDHDDAEAARIILQSWLDVQ